MLILLIYLLVGIECSNLIRSLSNRHTQTTNEHDTKAELIQYYHRKREKSMQRRSKSKRRRVHQKPMQDSHQKNSPNVLHHICTLRSIGLPGEEKNMQVLYGELGILLSSRSTYTTFIVSSVVLCLCVMNTLSTLNRQLFLYTHVTCKMCILMVWRLSFVL